MLVIKRKRHLIVGRQNKPHLTVSREKLMQAPTECWSGKVHGYPNKPLVGKSPWLPQQSVGQERPMAGPIDCWSGKMHHSCPTVGRERVFPSGLSPTDGIGRQYSFPTDCLSAEAVFPTHLAVGDVVLWCSGVCGDFLKLKTLCDAF